MIKGICNPIFLFLPAQEMILGNRNHSIKVKYIRFQTTQRSRGSKEDSGKLNEQLYGGTILVRPYSCHRIDAAAFDLSNRTTFVKGPIYKETPHDQKRGNEEKKPSTAAIVSHPISISISILHHHHSHSPPLVIVDLFSNWRHCKTIVINLIIFYIMFMIVDFISMCD